MDKERKYDILNDFYAEYSFTTIMLECDIYCLFVSLSICHFVFLVISLGTDICLICFPLMATCASYYSRLSLNIFFYCRVLKRTEGRFARGRIALKMSKTGCIEKRVTVVLLLFFVPRVISKFLKDFLRKTLRLFHGKTVAPFSFYYYTYR